MTESYDSSTNLKALFEKVRKDYDLVKHPYYAKPKANAGQLRDINPYQSLTSTEPSIQVKEIKPRRNEPILARSSFVLDKSRNRSKAASAVSQETLSTLVAVNEAKIEEPKVVRSHKRFLTEPPDQASADPNRVA